MKVAVTSQGKDMESQVDPRFGRAQYFLVVDTETGESQVVDNQQNLNAPSGAGIQAAQNIVNAGAEAIITGNVGPKAYMVLSTAGIKVYLSGSVTVSQAVQEFKNGKLEETGGANREGHWV
ncbi:MAG: NifB/NifX family molybdenum-iron cluster-binding protein [Planctomycetes bacterium]|nr:NifB/NifX family molybdenum-iron cluster-binding protein [Planctomycetota bacterium]